MIRLQFIHWTCVDFYIPNDKISPTDWKKSDVKRRNTPIYITNLDVSINISGRFVLPISTIAMVGFRINRILEVSKWYSVAWYVMKRHAVLHYYTKYQLHSIILYIHIDSYYFSTRNELHFWTSATCLVDGVYISERLLHICMVTYLHVAGRNYCFFWPYLISCSWTIAK